MNKVVFGLGFGDEGKGLVVDFLCSRTPGAMVVRFNGGHQAGHTVVRQKTKILPGTCSTEKIFWGAEECKTVLRHVFSNFGSGALEGCPTYWSKHCTVEPDGLISELCALWEKNIEPELYIDAACPVTTPYDIEYNRAIELANSHGSCGVGFGATMEREKAFYSLSFLDLFYPKILKSKLASIGDYYRDTMDTSKLKQETYRFLQACEAVGRYKKYIRLVFGKPKATCYIYEGAQGLLLDQHYGFYPNVTWSDCGSKNLSEKEKADISEIYLVTRAYQTRHGNGFMTNEELGHNILIDPLETNQPHPYQGGFRRSLLDIDLLDYAIKKDDFIRDSKNKRLVITCLDHLIEYKYTLQNNLKLYPSDKEYVDAIANHLGIEQIYISYNRESKYVTQIR